MNGYFLSGGFNPGFNLNAFQSIPAAPSTYPGYYGAFANFALPGGRAFAWFVDTELEIHPCSVDRRQSVIELDFRSQYRDPLCNANLESASLED